MLHLMKGWNAQMQMAESQAGASKIQPIDNTCENSFWSTSTFKSWVQDLEVLLICYF